MSQIFGYWYDLARLQLDDSGNTATWIQAMPLGKYQHPVYGEIEITPEKVKQYADNVNNKVRGQDLDIDFDHKATGGEAAGWVKQAEDRGSDGLWLLVEWTKSAYQKLKEKAYRYFSPEYNDEWTHPQTGVVHKNVLFGGALTNRPFLKNILAINMSELFSGVKTDPPLPPTTDPPGDTGGGGNRMDPKVIRQMLGLSEDATDEAVTAKLTELAARPAAPAAPAGPPDAPASPEEVARLIKSLSDVDGNPALKALTELVQAQQKQLSNMAWERHQDAVEKQLTDLDILMKDKQLAVPPAVKERLRDILLKSPRQLGDQVFEAYKQTLELGLIDMTERGWQRRGGETSPTQQYLTEIDAKMATNSKLSYADAAAQVARENPALAMQYRDESYIPSEGR
jgi:phage I-like protein